MVLTTLIQIATLFLTNGAASVPQRAIPAERSRRHVVETNVTQTATFHFVGLVMFTEVPDETPAARSAELIEQRPLHVVALMPSVKNWSHRHAARQRNDQLSTTAVSVDSAAIEDHDAVIAFPPDALISHTPNWTVVDPTANGGAVSGVPNLNYIVLGGEHLRFVADNEPNAPRLRDLTLPKIQGGVSLQAAYTSLTTSTLAALFEIPFGSLKACTGEATQNQRYDTNLTLRNHGTVTIETVDGTKGVTFYGDKVIELGNVPFSWLHDRAASSDASHVQVYCQMTGGGDNCQLGNFPVVNGCSDANMRMSQPRPRRKAPSLAQKVTGNETVEASDIFCSNTTWP